jgi:hypothetical protein
MLREGSAVPGRPRVVAQQPCPHPFLACYASSSMTQLAVDSAQWPLKIFLFPKKSSKSIQILQQPSNIRRKLNNTQKNSNQISFESFQRDIHNGLITYVFL